MLAFTKRTEREQLKDASLKILSKKRKKKQPNGGGCHAHSGRWSEVVSSCRLDKQLELEEQHGSLGQRGEWVEERGLHGACEQPAGWTFSGL